MKLTLGDEAFYFRSRGLFVFLNLLKEAHPNWVDLNAVYEVLPNTTPRQIARYIDLLETDNVRLVEYKTKTKGKFRLSVTPQLLTLPPLNNHSVLNHANTDIKNHAVTLNTAHHKLTDFLNSDWVTWLLGVVSAHLALMDGHLCTKNGALIHLNNALQASQNLPAWTKSIVYVRLGHACTRKCEYAEAHAWLRKAETLQRAGLAHPAVALRLCLLRAKLRYDQGKIADTKTLLKAAPLNNAPSPQLLSMQALLFGQQCFDDLSNAPSHLLNAFNLLSQAIGGVLLWQEDTSLLDALTYNFGNLMLRAVKLNVLPTQHVDLAAKWLASNIVVCRKLGVGEDSVLTDLLLFDVAHEHGVNTHDWHDYIKHSQPNFSKPHFILQRAERHARSQANPLELAECLRREMWIADNGKAQTSYIEALTILDAVKRPDIAQQLKEEFKQRVKHNINN